MSYIDTVDDETYLAKIKVCSSGMNAHNLPFTEETLIMAAESSLRNKPIVGKYNFYRKDMEGHEEDEVIIGVIPQNQKFEYVRNNETGITELYVDAILWKHYNYEVYEMFKKKKNKSVSMEIKINNIAKGWEGDNDIESIKKFSFLGVCVLGDSHTPASKGANIDIMKFSSEEYNEKTKEVEDKYMKYFEEEKTTIEIDNSKESATTSSKWSNQGSKLFKPLLNATNWKTAIKEAYLVVDIPNGAKAEDVSGSQDLSYPHHSLVDGSKLVVNKKGVIAAHQRAAQQGIVSGDVLKHLKKHYKELGLRTEEFVANQENFSGEKLSKTEVKEFAIVEENMDLQKKLEELQKNFEELKKEKEDVEKNYATLQEDQKKKDDEAKKKEEETKKKGEEGDFEAEKKDYEDKIAEYAKKIEEMEETKKKTDVYMEEYEQLKKDKKESQKKEMETKVEKTFEMVSESLPPEEMEKFKTRFSSEEISFENHEAFCNEIKAKTLEFSFNKKNKQTKNFALNNVGVESKERKLFDGWDSNNGGNQ